MQLTKTVILKIQGGDDELGKLLSAFSEGMNYASGNVFENGKPMGSGRIQKATYRHLRNELRLKSQMCCNVARQVAGAYKTLQDQVLSGQVEWQLLEFDPTSATFSFERDFGFGKDNLSITTLAGRKRYKIQVYRHAEKYFDGSWRYSASKLCLHKNGSYFFHLCCEKEIQDKPMSMAV
jgi:putative transposase